MNRNESRESFRSITGFVYLKFGPRFLHVERPYCTNIHSKIGDWDKWIRKDGALHRNRDVIVPEVSRVFHAGDGGAHVNGFEQATFFDRIITTSASMAALEPLSGYVLQFR